MSVPGFRIGCWTGVKGRELYLRSCLMQMLLQTHRPDHYLVLINGDDAESYDRRAVADLIEPWISIATIPRAMTTREVSTSAVERLLEADVQLFFKIDSDDLYFRNYFESIVAYVESHGLLKGEKGFCINLIEQLWLNEKPGGGASVHNYKFHNGLGLTEQEKAKGMRVGAPPTYVFNRAAAELLVKFSNTQMYARFQHDDCAWRQILFDHGIVIQQVRTPQPVFGYLRHSDNSCAVWAKKSQ